MFCAQGWPVEAQQTTALEDSVDDGLSKVVVVQDGTPGARVLVGGEDHGALANLALVDHVVEHVGGVAAVGEVADLVHDENVRAHVDGQGFAKTLLSAGSREVVNELGGGQEARIKAVLQSAVSDGDGEMRLAAAGFALEYYGTAFGDEVG